MQGKRGPGVVLCALWQVPQLESRRPRPNTPSLVHCTCHCTYNYTISVYVLYLPKVLFVHVCMCFTCMLKVHVPLVSPTGSASVCHRCLPTPSSARTSARRWGTASPLPPHTLTPHWEEAPPRVPNPGCCVWPLLAGQCHLSPLPAPSSQHTHQHGCVQMLRTLCV